MTNNHSLHEQIAHYHNKLQYEIDSWDLFHALKSGANIVVIDARSREAYQHEHIYGAINFPHREMTDQMIQEKLDKTILYVTYCDGIGCNASTKGALKLAQSGYQVKELLGGIDWWKRDGYQTTSLSRIQPNQCGC